MYKFKTTMNFLNTSLQLYSEQRTRWLQCTLKTDTRARARGRILKWFFSFFLRRYIYSLEIRSEKMNACWSRVRGEKRVYIVNGIPSWYVFQTFNITLLYIYKCRYLKIMKGRSWPISGTRTHTSWTTDTKTPGRLAVNFHARPIVQGHSDFSASGTPLSSPLHSFSHTPTHAHTHARYLCTFTI